MNLDIVKTVLPKLVGGRISTVLQAKSPQILLVVGVGGMVASTVMACRATLKVNEILEDARKQIGTIDYCFNTTEVPSEKYTDQDRKKDLTIVYTQTAMKFVKLYGPPVALGAVSIYCVVSGHGVLQRRNVALAAAYKLVDDSFRRYRARVVDAYGADVEHRLYHDLRAETIVEADTETGKITKTKTLVPNDPNKVGMYTRIFEEGNPEWQDTLEYNRIWLQGQQNMCNNLLHARGHLFLNEVLEMLGFEHTSAGQVVGWMSKGDGDGYVSFGIFDGEYTIAKSAFINGTEKAILLDFNVDGSIWNNID